MQDAIALIGFGEAATAFLTGWATRPDAIVAYDRKTADPTTRSGQIDAYRRCDLSWRETAADAVREAKVAISLVTADQSLAAAETAADALATGAFWFDMNSVAPQTKLATATVIGAAGGRYVDVAVMAPVEARQAATPMLLSGADAVAGADILRAIGFTNVRVVEGPVGAASSIKMVRSVLVKGLEALTAECIIAAHAAGVADEVAVSLNASWPGTDWSAKADYNLDRMMVHGPRRAAEMEEAVKMLDALGTGSAMTRATVEWQHAIGALSAGTVETLAAKIDLIRSAREGAQ